MLQWLSRAFHWFEGSTSKLLLFTGGLLLIWGTLAPVGTLVWWFEQRTERLGRSPQSDPLGRDRATSKSNSANIDCYIIFLTGVGDYSSDQLTPGEELFLDRLVQLQPNCVAVRNVFPYSATNKDLADERFLAPVWQAAEQADGWFQEADILIKIRNLWRFAISADERYGPIYNQGIADAIVEQMDNAHPLPESHSRSLQIVLIGTSGGAQVALGAVPYLNNWVEAELIVISAGGTFDGKTGFNYVDQVYHLQGDRDWIEDIPRFIFPSRWPWTIGSPFNQAQRQGRYTVLNSGPHTHDGEEGYFGKAIEPSSQMQYVELTLQKVNQLPFWTE